MKNKILSLIAIVSLMAGCSPPESGNAPPTASATASNITLTTAQRQSIHLQTVQQAGFHRMIETTGTVGFDNDQATTVLAPISGPVSKLVADLGSNVKKNDPLALIESPDYAAAVSAYRKGVVTASNARRIATLDEQLFKDDAIARRDMEQAQTDAVNAEADRDAALQQLRSLGVNDDTIKDIQENRPVSSVSGIIRSPLTGTVVEKLITPGQLLQAGTTPCFTVADLSKVWVMANIFESDLSSIALGDAADVMTSATPEVFKGKVDNISAIIDPNTHAIGVRVVAENPSGVLKKQMYVRVLIHSSRENKGLLAPVSAVLRDDENLPFVYISRPDGSFERRRITLGPRVGDQYEITTGLKEGEEIVVEGGLFVQFQQNQ